MSITRHDNGHRWRDYFKYDVVKFRMYDYERDGLLVRLLPKRYTDSKNPVFQAVLLMVEKPFVKLMKSIDSLNNFRNHHFRNY